MNAKYAAACLFVLEFKDWWLHVKLSDGHHKIILSLFSGFGLGDGEELGDPLSRLTSRTWSERVPSGEAAKMSGLFSRRGWSPTKMGAARSWTLAVIAAAAILSREGKKERQENREKCTARSSSG